MLSTGQLVTEEFYALGKLVRLGMGLRHYDGNTTLCMAERGVGLQAELRQPTARRAATRTSSWPTCVVLWGANIADNHPLLVPRVLGRRAAAR